MKLGKIPKHFMNKTRQFETSRKKWVEKNFRNIPSVVCSYGLSSHLKINFNKNNRLPIQYKLEVCNTKVSKPKIVQSSQNLVSFLLIWNHMASWINKNQYGLLSELIVCFILICYYCKHKILCKNSINNKQLRKIKNKIKL